MSKQAAGRQADEHFMAVKSNALYAVYFNAARIIKFISSFGGNLFHFQSYGFPSIGIASMSYVDRDQAGEYIHLAG